MGLQNCFSNTFLWFSITVDGIKLHTHPLRLIMFLSEVVHFNLLLVL